MLRQEMERAGAISLARFMELALYCPKTGYYEREEGRAGANSDALSPVLSSLSSRIGRGGDFYTSVCTGSLFGELLAFQFADWLGEASSFEFGVSRGRRRLRRTRNPKLETRNSFHLVEAGAHDGRLAFDILSWLGLHRPDLLRGMEYWLIEPSLRRQSWQRARLEQFAGQVRWAESIQTLPNSGVNGVIFSNEFLDAFPVHRLVWDRASRKWVEWGVGVSDEQFVWRPLPCLGRDWGAELARAGFVFSPELEDVLPDGFIVEHCPAARTWWREAAAALRQGWLLTMDYGLAAQQFLSPERSQGTLRGYRGHQLVDDVLANPGEQDLTAHVNFTQLQMAGEDEGLSTEGCFSQAQFLTGIAGKMWMDGSPSPSQARQFQTLTHPEHLGRSFRVLIQSRNG
jgi:SAM-dependent MidA family methyltransferase